MPDSGMPTAPKANISFGPKRIERRRERSVVESVSLVLLIVAVLIAVGMFMYRFSLQRTLTSVQADIASAQNVSTLSMYNDVRSFDRKVRAARYIFDRRIGFGRLFGALEDSVSRSVFYQSFEAATNEAGDITLALGGVSPAIAQVVLQSGDYSAQPLLSDVRISRIELRRSETQTDTLFNVQAHISRDGLHATSTRSATQAPVQGAPSDATPMAATTSATSSSDGPITEPNQ